MKYTPWFRSDTSSSLIPLFRRICLTVCPIADTNSMRPSPCRHFVQLHLSSATSPSPASRAPAAPRRRWSPSASAPTACSQRGPSTRSAATSASSRCSSCERHRAEGAPGRKARAGRAKDPWLTHCVNQPSAPSRPQGHPQAQGIGEAFDALAHRLAQTAGAVEGVGGGADAHGGERAVAPQDAAHQGGAARRVIALGDQADLPGADVLQQGGAVARVLQRVARQRLRDDARRVDAAAHQPGAHGVGLTRPDDGAAADDEQRLRIVGSENQGVLQTPLEGRRRAAVGPGRAAEDDDGVVRLRRRRGDRSAHRVRWRRTARSRRSARCSGSRT